MPSPTGLSRETLSSITPEADMVYVSCDAEGDGPIPGIHLPARAILVVYPTWDVMYHHWYTVRFAGRNPMGHAAMGHAAMGHAALCAKSFGAGVLGRPFTRTGKDHFPSEWFEPPLPHTHDDLNDAVALTARTPCATASACHRTH